MLASAVSVVARVARYLAAPVWLGFIFLLDPINARLGGESLSLDWRVGRLDRSIESRCSSGLLCGVLWEFWNYWSRAKWHYTVPIMEHVKIFEMPVPGYLGFPAFALECFTMYVSSAATRSPVRRWCRPPVPLTVVFTGDRSRYDPPRAAPLRGPRRASASAHRRARQAGHAGGRRTDRPAHHPLARRTGDRRGRAEPAPSAADADRGASATAAISGFARRYSWEQPRILGSAGGPRLARPIVGAERFWLSTATRSPTCRLAAIERAHAATGARVTLALVRNREFLALRRRSP